jgi:hypothetical protein
LCIREIVCCVESVGKPTNPCEYAVLREVGSDGVAG